MPRFRIARGWAWLWWIGAAELVLLGLEAVPVFRPAPAAVAEARSAATSAVAPVRVSLQPIQHRAGIAGEGGHGYSLADFGIARA